MGVSVLALHLCDAVADWDAAVHHYDSIILHTYLKPKKRAKFKTKVWFLLNMYHFLTIVKLKIISIAIWLKIGGGW